MLIDSDLAPWLGAAFELGGTMCFSFQTDGKTGEISDTRPTLRIYDHDLVRIAYLKELFGGTTYPKGNPTNWLVRGAKAACLAEAIEPFAPSRTAICKAMISWHNEDLKQKVEAATLLKNHDRMKRIPDNAYDKLITLPAFLAGVIDHYVRIGEKVREANWKVYPKLEVTNSNQPFMECLQSHWGGNLTPVNQEGETVINGTKTVIKYPSLTWELVNGRAIELLRYAQEDLRIKQSQVQRWAA